VEIKEGDLVVTLPKVEKVRSIMGRLVEGLIGVVVETSPRFDDLNVYGVLIDGEMYYLFEDEISKMEKE
jgi:ATP-dependent exoDNAse (exonuclease V) alpha subunit